MKSYRPLAAVAALVVLTAAGCSSPSGEAQGEGEATKTASPSTTASATPSTQQSPTAEPTPTASTETADQNTQATPPEETTVQEEPATPEQGREAAAQGAAPVTPESAQEPAANAPLPGQETGHIPDPVSDDAPTTNLIPAGAPALVGMYFGQGAAPVQITSPNGATGSLIMSCGGQETGRIGFSLAAGGSATESLNFSGQQCTLEIQVDTGEAAVSPQTPIYS